MAPIGVQDFSSIEKRAGVQTKVNTTLFSVFYGLLGVVFLSIVLMFSILYGRRLSNHRVDRRKRSALIMAAAFRSPKVMEMQEHELGSAPSNTSQPMEIRRQSRGQDLPAVPSLSSAPSRLQSLAVPDLASPSGSLPAPGDATKFDAPSPGSNTPGSDLTETQDPSSTEAAASISISEAAGKEKREGKAKASKTRVRRSKGTYERYAAPTPLPTIFEDESYER